MSMKFQVVVLVGLFLSGGKALFADEGKWLEGFGVSGFDGSVFSMATDVNGEVYVAGGFTLLDGVVGNHIAKWDSVEGGWESLGAGLNDIALSIFPDQTGDIIVGGLFTRAGDAAVSHVARWKTSSNTWHSIGDGVPEQVLDLVGDGSGNLFASGNAKIWRWDSTVSTWSDIGPSIVNRDSLAVDSTGNLYTATNNRFAMWHVATNTWEILSEDSFDTGSDVAVLFIDEQNNIYVGGNVANNGESGNVAIWNSSSASFEILGAKFTDSVSALTIDSAGELLAGDSFSENPTAKPIWQWNSTVEIWERVDSRISIYSNSNVYAFTTDGTGRLYAGGNFGVSRWTGSSWDWLSDPTVATGLLGMNGSVNTLVTGPNDSVIIGGSFTLAGNQWVNRIVALDSSYTGFSPMGIGLDGEVNALAVDGSGDVYAVGEFQNAGSVSVKNVARWSNSSQSWEAIGAGVSGTDSFFRDGSVRAITIGQNGSIYVGGTFGTSSGTRYLAKWTEAAGAWQYIDSPVFGTVFALATDSQGNVYVGGCGADIQMLNVSSGAWESLGAGVNDCVFALATDADGRVYVGGQFSSAGGVAAENIARWVPETEEWETLGAGVDGRVWSLATDGSDIYVGGEFVTAGNVDAARISVWSATTKSWSALSGGGLDGRVFSVEVASDGRIFVGGDFRLAGNVASSRIAVWQKSLPADDRDTDGDGITDFFDLDDDNDGMPDAWELRYSLDELDPGDASEDPDGDGRNNLQEYMDSTDPTVFDEPAGLPLVDDVEIGLGVLLNELKYTVDLDSPLPEGYGVFLNFDNQQGGWYEQGQDGGHFQLPLEEGSTYATRYIFNRAGLRSVRAGIFRLGETRDQDVLMGIYSAGTLCTVDACLNTIIPDGKDGIGNPAMSGSGGMLDSGVDIGSGNYHMSSIDLTVSAKGVPFTLRRAYNSKSDTPWTFGYESRIRYLPDTFQRQLVIGPREDGRYQQYFKEMDHLGGKWLPLDPGNFDQLIEAPGGSFTQYTRGNRVYRYAAPSVATPEQSGQLVAIEDRLGNGLSMTHISGQLSVVTDANGRNYTIQRDGNSRITAVSDHTGRSVSYSYNAQGLVAAYTNPRGNTTTYSYTGSNADSMLQSITDPRQNALVNLTYNSNDHVASVKNAVGDTVSFLYDRSDAIEGEGTGVVRATINGINHSKIYRLDDSRRCFIGMIDAENVGDFQSKTNRAGAANRNEIAKTCLVAEHLQPANRIAGLGANYSYTDDGRTQTVERELDTNRSLTTALTYTDESSNQPNLRLVATETRAGINTPRIFNNFSSTGKAREITDSRGNTTTRVFNAANDWLTSEQDPLSRVTSYTYYATGLVHTVTDALGNVTTYEYDDVGRMIKETSPLGLVITYQYDNNGNLTSRNDKAAVDGIDYTTTYEYDPSDNLIRMVDPLQLETTYTYDAANRRISSQYQVGTDIFARGMEYDALGRMFRITDERNNQSRTYFTARSLVSKRENGLGETVTEMTYDANGNVKAVTDGEDRTVTYSYDALDRKTSATYDDQESEYWQYDDAGRVTQYTDRQGRITSYEYDNEGNLEKTFDANGGVTEAKYDYVGNLTEVKDPNGNSTLYTYDALNRRTSTEFPDGQTWLYSYDANGNQVSEITPTGEKIEHLYDAMNRVTRRTERASTEAGGGVIRQIDYTYDANGNVRKELSGGSEINYQYDKINRVVSVTDQYGQTIGYGYDKASNRISMTYPGNLVVTYGYDQADRLASVQDWLGNVTSYTRNAAGQITRTSNGNGTIAEYEYDTLGRLKELTNTTGTGKTISSHSLSYDDAGNITGINAEQPLLPSLASEQTAFKYTISNFIETAGASTFEVDDSGRLIEEAESGETTEYQFNVNDLITRVSKNNQTFSTYKYDLRNNRVSRTEGGVEKRFVIDQLAELPNVIAENTSTNEPQVRYVYGDGLISRIQANNEVQYYHFDQTGHTVALTEGNGAVTDQYAYTPYGKTTASGGAENPFRYVGRYGVMDDGDELYYMRARYYRGDLSRFLTLDILEGAHSSSQSVNRLIYSKSNPVSVIDPSGLSGVGINHTGGMASNCLGPGCPRKCHTGVGDYCARYYPSYPDYSTSGVAGSDYIAGSDYSLSNFHVSTFGGATSSMASNVFSEQKVGTVTHRFNYEYVKGGYPSKPKYITQNSFKPRFSPNESRLLKTRIEGIGTVVTIGITTSTSVYNSCKNDTRSDECTARIVGVFVGNVAGGIASVASSIVCLPATPVASAVCAAAIGGAVSTISEAAVFAMLTSEVNTVPAELYGAGALDTVNSEPDWLK